MYYRLVVLYTLNRDDYKEWLVELNFRNKDRLKDWVKNNRDNYYSFHYGVALEQLSPDENIIFEDEERKSMSKLYNVHVSEIMTTNILVEADSEEEARDIVSNHLDSDAIQDSLSYGDDKVEAWEVNNPENFSQYFVMNKDGKMERRNN